jgi:hypothetical protein
MTRLSAEETTGISLFAFIILGLVTLFSVTRMKNSVKGKLFAIMMSFITLCAALWYFNLLFADENFFRNLYYVLDRQTQSYELLPLASRIGASVPLALLMLGAGVYGFSGFAIILLGITGKRK